MKSRLMALFGLLALTILGLTLALGYRTRRLQP